MRMLQAQYGRHWNNETHLENSEKFLSCLSNFLQDDKEMIRLVRDVAVEANGTNVLEEPVEILRNQEYGV